MVANISSCFVWDSRVELRFGYSIFSLLFKDESYPLLITKQFVLSILVSCVKSKLN